MPNNFTGVNISRKECTNCAGIVLGIQGRVSYFLIIMASIFTGLQKYQSNSKVN